MLCKGIFAKTQVIFIAALISVKTGMRFGGHCKNAVNDDVFGQKLVESPYKLGWKLAFKIKMGKILFSMHPRVGTTATGDFQFSAEDGAHVFFQGLLHGVFAGLALPAEVGGAVVGEFDEVARHGGTSGVGRR